MSLSRSSVTIYDDQYNFYKAFNSQKLLVSFVEFIRPEQKFSSVEELKMQLTKDIEKAKNYH